MQRFLKISLIIMMLFVGSVVFAKESTASSYFHQKLEIELGEVMIGGFQSEDLANEADR